LRALFRNKAFLAHQQRLCETLLADNNSAEQLAGFSLADIPDGTQARLYLTDALSSDSTPDRKRRLS